MASTEDHTAKSSELEEPPAKGDFSQLVFSGISKQQCPGIPCQVGKIRTGGQHIDSFGLVHESLLSVHKSLDTRGRRQGKQKQAPWEFHPRQLAGFHYSTLQVYRAEARV